MTNRTQMAGGDQRVNFVLPTLSVAFLITAAILFLLVPHLDKFFAYRYSAHFEDGYDRIAANLAHGYGYRWQADMGETMIREPGYPLFLAAVFKLGGYRLEAARFANWLLSIGIALMIIRLARMVTGDHKAALIAALLFLFHPGTLISEARGGVEILFIFALLAFMLMVHSAVKSGNAWRYFIAGLGLGVVVQVRSTPLVFPVMLMAYLALTSHDWRERWKAFLGVAALAFGMVLVMTPWIVRNYLLVHQFVPTATIQGLAIQEGQYTCQNLSFENNYYDLQTGAGRERNMLAAQLGIPSGHEYYQVYETAADEWKLNNALFQHAKREYLAHPGLFATCAGRNVLNFWFLGKTWAVTWLNTAVQLPFLALALSGILLLRKHLLLDRMGIMLTCVVSVWVVHLAIIAEARYSIPVLALLTIPASVSVLSIWQALTATKNTAAGLVGYSVRS